MNEKLIKVQNFEEEWWLSSLKTDSWSIRFNWFQRIFIFMILWTSPPEFKLGWSLAFIIRLLRSEDQICIHRGPRWVHTSHPHTAWVLFNLKGTKCSRFSWFSRINLQTGSEFQGLTHQIYDRTKIHHLIVLISFTF